jgi:hypothetical protein
LSIAIDENSPEIMATCNSVIYITRLHLRSRWQVRPATAPSSAKNRTGMSVRRLISNHFRDLVPRKQPGIDTRNLVAGLKELTPKQALMFFSVLVINYTSFFVRADRQNSVSWLGPVTPLIITL